MPEKAGESRVKFFNIFLKKAFKNVNKDKVKTFIDDLSLYKDKMNRLQYRTLEELERNYNETKKIPQNKYVEFVGLCSNSELVLGKGHKEASDFEIFKPYLER